ncbi:MAG TPA: hypothetical protein VEU96_16105 [Bryobacteraceae bacterium]|nr:hypothetical protein [Bryobacteraceae bacterium]
MQRILALNTMLKTRLLALYQRREEVERLIQFLETHKDPTPSRVPRLTVVPFRTVSQKSGGV